MMAGIGQTNAAATLAIDSNDFLKALVYERNSGFEKWDANALTYTLNKNDDNPDNETVGVWTQALTNSIQAAIADVEAISGLTFTETADTVNGSDGADIDFWYYNNSSDGASGYSYTVAGSGVYIDEDSVRTSPADGLTYGGTNHRTVIHELLHNIGIAHPHSSYAKLPGVTSSGDTGDYALNQNLYTVMSYNRSRQVDDTGEQTTGWPNFASTADQSYAVLGAFDIAVVQAIYGANTATATGDDIYDIPTANGTGTYFKAIWDAGGTDTLRYLGSDDVRIDLRAATLDISDGMLAGGIASRVVGIYGGFTIANGVVIENAEGGAGRDTLRGNSADNTITGNAGKDFIFGAGGADILFGGGGGDKIRGSSGDDVTKGNGGSDKIWAGSGNDKVIGSNGNDQLLGQVGNDLLSGGNQNDRLTGGLGDDRLTGGAGNDVFVFDSDSNTGRDRIRDWEDGSDMIEISGTTVFDDLTIKFKATRTVITWDTLNKIVLDGVTSGITEADFDFV